MTSWRNPDNDKKLWWKAEATSKAPDNAAEKLKSLEILTEA